MSTIVIKNVPEPLHAKLKAQAQNNHRSLTKEALSLLELGLLPQTARRPLPPPIKLKGGPLTIEEMEQAIAEGRE